MFQSFINAIGKFTSSSEVITTLYKLVEKFISDKSILEELKVLLNGLDDWNQDNIDNVLKNYQSEKGLSVPAVNQPIRISLTGSTKSPGLGLTLFLFGRNKSLERISNLLSYLS